MVDVMEELVKFTLLTRHVSPWLNGPPQRARKRADETGQPALYAL
jgi:hypothetical protein